MALDVLDGAGLPAQLDTDESGGVHTPRNKVISLPGTVETDIAASKGYLLQLIGTIASGKINVDVKAVSGAFFAELALTAQSGLNSWTSDWIDARPYAHVFLVLNWTAVASTNGTLSLEGSAHPTQNASCVHDLTSLIATYYGTWPTVGATAAGVTIPLDKIFPYLRWKYTRVAGGAVDQFTPFVFGRGAA